MYRILASIQLDTIFSDTSLLDEKKSSPLVALQKVYEKRGDREGSTPFLPAVGRGKGEKGTKMKGV